MQIYGDAALNNVPLKFTSVFLAANVFAYCHE